MNATPNISNITYTSLTGSFTGNGSIIKSFGTSSYVAGTSYISGYATGSIGLGTSIVYSGGGSNIAISTAGYSSNNVPFVFCEQKLIPGKLYKTENYYNAYTCKFTDDKKTIFNFITQKTLNLNPIIFLKKIEDNYIFYTSNFEFIVFKQPTMNTYGNIVILNQL